MSNLVEKYGPEPEKDQPPPPPTSKVAAFTGIDNLLASLLLAHAHDRFADVSPTRALSCSLYHSVALITKCLSASIDTTIN